MGWVGEILQGVKDFKLAEVLKERITLKLTNERIDQLTSKIRDAVRDTMKADYAAFKSATA